MIAPARIAAYRVLSALSARQSDLSHALAAARESLQDERDRALTAEIVIGVQRWRASLDHLITHYSRRPPERLDPEVLDVLRLGVYQLLHLTRVPAAAVVDDAVSMTKRLRKRSASGLVNAVLRAVSRARKDLPLPPRPGPDASETDVLDYLSVTLSHPRWLVARWLRRYGFEATEAWLRFNNTPAPLTLRANRLRNSADTLIGRLTNEGVSVRRAGLASDGLIVESGAPLQGHGLREGWFVVQDEASQLVAMLAAVGPGHRLLDTCASPGGKATAFAAAMEGRGLLVACDVRESRLDVLRRTVAASGASNIRIVRADLRRPLPFVQPFDCVFVDAPCSGLGTLRRDPDIRWRRLEADLATFRTSQLAMLQHAAANVAVGGELIYATCSSEPEENRWVVESFLNVTPDFSMVDLRRVDPRVPASVLNDRGQLETLPHVHGLEAFFGAVLRRHD